MSPEPAYTMLPVRDTYSDDPNAQRRQGEEDDLLPLDAPSPTPQQQQQREQQRPWVRWLHNSSSSLSQFRHRRRRLPSWRIVVVFGVLAYVAYCFITWQPLFAHNLPDYTGPHSVGAIDVEVPVSNPRVIREAKFKNDPERDAFQLDTVLFTLYYPATKGVVSEKPRHRWIPKPVALTAEGYARAAHISNWFTNAVFSGAIKLLVGGLEIPAEVDVPLGGKPPGVESLDGDEQATTSRETKREAEESTAKLDQIVLGASSAGHLDTTATTGKYPILVFTHGMASSRTDYTHYCGELASRGYIVAAIEHRDGSSPGSLVTREGKEDEQVILFNLNDILQPDDEKSKMDIEAFKDAQLSFRQAEIEAVVETMRSINNGQGAEVLKFNTRGEGDDFSNWSGRLNTDEMILAGHSYGATGVLRALKPDKNGSPSPNLPFKGVIALDPGKSSGPLNADISVPLMVIHSNSWSKSKSMFYGRPHFSVVRDIVEGVNARGFPSWFMTSLGTSHPSVTDAPLIEPLLLSWTTGAKIDVYEGLRQYMYVSEDFMWFLGLGGEGKKGEKRGLLKEHADYPEYDESAGWGRYHGQGEDWKRFWQVHVAPPKGEEEGQPSSEEK